MSDETTTALREIAELLKKRVEQEDAVAARTLESSKRGAEYSARIKEQAEKGQAQAEEIRRRAEEMRIQFSPENRDRLRAESERRREEDRQFQKSLLSELERHNALLSEIIERLRQSPKE